MQSGAPRPSARSGQPCASQTSTPSQPSPSQCSRARTCPARCSSRWLVDWRARGAQSKRLACLHSLGLVWSLTSSPGRLRCTWATFTPHHRWEGGSNQKGFGGTAPTRVICSPTTTTTTKNTNTNTLASFPLPQMILSRRQFWRLHVLRTHGSSPCAISHVRFFGFDALMPKWFAEHGMTKVCVGE